MQASDAEFIKAFQKGHQKAFKELVQRYEKPVFGYILTRINDYSAAEDITQETFLRVYRSLKNPRVKWRGNDPRGFASWLFTIAQNCCQEWLRNSRHQPSRAPDSSLEQVAVTHSFTTKAEGQKEEIMEALQRCLKKLPEEYYAVLSLKYQNGLTCVEIAKALGQPIGTVTSTLARAYELLRKEMKTTNEM